MLIHVKDDIEFVTEFPCLLGRPVEKSEVFNSDTISFLYSETLNNEYIERIHQMSYSSLSDNEMLHTFSFLIK